MSSIRVSVLIGLCAALVQKAVAQGTNATCLTGFEWMFNSRSQSPCLMTAYLNSACLTNPADAYVYSLPDDYHYRPPTALSATACQCSTVFYSMIAACSTCQDRITLPWSTWENNCTTVYDKIFPRQIPSGTSIPAWAYLDVTNGDAFNVTAAQAVANQKPPESSAGSGQATQTSGTTAPSSGASSTSAPQPSSKKSNVGPIVGGVVGGVGGFIILVGVGIWWWIRHKNAKRNAAAAAPNQAAVPFMGGSNGVPNSPYTDEKPNQFASAPPVHTPVPTMSPTMSPTYNPDDPRTWPGYTQTPIGSMVPSAYSGYPQPSTTPYPQPSTTSYPQPGHAPTFPHQPGAYTGVPEI